jgi:3D (Asp-Asp-Asp) domain-containing protein
MLVTTIYFTFLVLWQYNAQCEYQGVSSQLQEEKLTTSQLEPLSLIVVDTKVRVSCYVDTGTMASGKQTYKGAVAVSDRRIPMGTKIYLEEFGEMTVEDKTAKWVDTKFELSTIDVWMTEKECKEFGLKTLSYVIVK